MAELIMAKRYLIRDSIRQLVGSDDIQETAAGALPSDDASQARLPLLRKKLAAIAALPDQH